MKIIIVLLLLYSCGKKEETSIGDFFCTQENTQMPELDGRDTFLIVGDSISWGYFREMPEYFPENQIIHNPCNGKNSSYGAQYIEKWANHSNKWKYCTFNHGIWNTLPGNNETGYPWNVGDEQYIQDLLFEASILRQSCENVIFINITPIPIGHPTFFNESIVHLNNISKIAMDEIGMVTCDLYNIGLTMEAYRSNGVHYNSEGSNIFAQKIKDCFDNL